MNILRTVGAVALACLAATGCGIGDAPEPAPAPAATPSASPESAAPTAPIRQGRPVGSTSAGSVGLTVRYQSPDGSIKTLQVEDFRR